MKFVVDVEPERFDRFAISCPWNHYSKTSPFIELKKPEYQGLTILGGEPFEPENQQGLIDLIRSVKQELPGKDIWMYTGYSYEDLLPGGIRHYDVTDEIMNAIDVLVDGRFLLGEKNITLRFRGSRNQRLIDMKRTRQEGQVVLWT